MTRAASPAALLAQQAQVFGASALFVIPAAVAPVDSPHAFITKGSLTETQITSSTPLAASWSFVRMKLGTCAIEQVGV